MIAEQPGVGAAAPASRSTPLTKADAPEMLALATLTRPGPFFAAPTSWATSFGVREAG